MAILKVTGLWWRETKDGKRYLSGRCSNTRILIFENDKTKARDPSKAPDYELLVGPVDETKPLTPLPPLLEGQTIADVAATRGRSSPTRWPSGAEGPPEDDPRFSDKAPF